MKFLAKWSLRNKAAMIVMVVLTLGLGTASYFILPIEFLPEADNPQVTVSTIGQGYNAHSMTQQVTEPIEDAVSTLKGKTDVLSTTGDGYSQVNVNFDSETEMKEAKREVQEALAGLQLPDGVSKPHVIQYDTSMIPIAQVSLAFQGGTDKDRKDEIEKDILPKFQAIKGVGDVQFFGQSNPTVVVKLDKEKLAKAHIPLQSVMNLLQGQDLSVSIGEKAIDRQMSNLKVTGNIGSLKDLRELSIQSPTPNAPTVPLKKIASVKYAREQTSISRINGKEGTGLSITKEANASAVDVGKGIEKVVRQLNHDHKNLHADVLFSSSDMIVDSVNSMLREVLLGALFATIVIVLFLRNLRSTLITAVSIPLSLALTLFLLWKTGVSLNILTLGGVAVAVGRLVDDSIVVVENIFRRKQLGTFSKEMLIEATGEVGKAITASTIATIAVFLPMGLINGSLKAFLLPFALTVTYSLLASLIVALTVVPLMSAGLLKHAKLPEHKEPKRYMKFLTWNLNHKWLPIVTVIVVFVGSVVLYTIMPKGAINAEDASMVSVKLTYPSDTPPAKVRGKTKAFEKDLMKINGYQSIITQQGNSEEDAQWGAVSNPTEANYTVIMKENADADQFVKAVKKQKRSFSDAEIEASTASFMSSGNSSTITYDITGQNEADLDHTAKAVKSVIQDVKGVKKISSNQDDKKPQYTFVVNNSKENTQQVATQLSALLNETPLGTVHLGDKDTKVMLETDVNPTSEKDLKQIRVETNKGPVPVSSIAKIEKSEQSSTVLHKDGKPFVRLSVDVNPKNLSVISKELRSKIKKVHLPDGVKLVTGGATEQQSDDFTDLGLTMLVSIGLVYLIMVLTFKTLRAPLAILITLPLASIGAVLGLLVTNVPVDPTALLGGLMLIGIVVTNAIVLIDRVKQNEKTMTIREAIVEAAATRIRPILMTAVATICAMLPLLFAHVEEASLVSKGLAVVVIGGLTVATALTLVVVPVFYELFYFRTSKKQRIQAKQESHINA